MNSLILSVVMDPESTERMTLWRQRFFPPERNFLPAHLTLFHKLPGGNLNAIKTVLAGVAQTQKCCLVNFTQIEQNGGFVAIKVHSEAMEKLRQTLVKAFHFPLMPQDQQPWRPHVTITNKVTPSEGSARAQLLSDEFRPWDGWALALELSEYRDGPWETAGVFNFVYDYS